jgi:hypothetical protein
MFLSSSPSTASGPSGQKVSIFSTFFPLWRKNATGETETTVLSIGPRRLGCYYKMKQPGG